MKPNLFFKISLAFYPLLIFVLLLGCGMFIPTLPVSPTHTPSITLTSSPSPTATLPPIPTPSINLQSSIAMDRTCRSVVDGLQTIKKGLKYPDHYSTGDYSRQASDFDPNLYFKVFTHLQMSPDYVLDYLMFSDTLGGKPLLYARKTDASPFKSDDEFLKSLNENGSDQRTLSTLKHSQDYLQKIVLDGSPESYYQLITLSMFGDQFYLAWHGNYNDAQMVCDLSDLKSINADLQFFNLSLPQDVTDRAQDINFHPGIIVKDKTVTARFITFSKWGGFVENLVVFNSQAPYQTINHKQTNLVSYECGILF